MKKKCISLLIMGVIFSFTSCQDDKNESQIIEEIMPIAVGNNWTYAYHNLSYETTDTSISSIGEFKEINGYGGYEYGSNLIKSDENGNTILVCSYSETDTIYPETIVYMKNLEIGESFDYHMIVRSEDDNGSEILEERTVEETCINKDTLISVPAGDFNCIVYEYSPDNGSNIFKLYLSIGVGSVKTERFEDGIHFSTTELLDYEIK
jgi:hypothetical protein